MIGALIARYQPTWLEQVRLGAPLRVGPTGKLALFLDSKWNREALFVQIVTQLDEAGTHRESPYMIMAGHVGRLAQWYRLERQWNKKLRKHGLDYYHVKEMRDHPFAQDGASIITNNLMFGFVTRLNRDDFEKHYKKREGWGGKSAPDSMYGLCFRYSLAFILRKALEEFERPDLELNFVVESGNPNEGAPAEIISQIKRKKIAGVSEYLGNAIPGEKKKYPGLQAADGLASSAWQLEKSGGIVRNDSPAMASGLMRQQKMPIYRCHIDEKELRQFTDVHFEYIKFRREYWESKRNVGN